MIQLFKQYQPINYFIIIFTAILLWLKVFINNDIPAINQYDSPLSIYELIYSFLHNNNLIILSKLIAFVLIIIQTSIISATNNQFNLLGFRSYLPGLIYILFISNFDEFKVLHPIHFANLFFTLAWFQLSKSDNSSSSSNYFNSAFFVGLSSLFYFNYIYLIFVIISHSLINRQISIKKIMIIFIGLFTAWYLYLSILFIITGHFQDLSLLFNFQFTFNNFADLNINNVILFIYTISLILFATYNLSKYYFKLKNNHRNTLSFLFQLFIVSLFLIIFTNSGFEIVFIFTIPVSLFLSLFFSRLRSKWLAESLFFIFIVIVIINNIYPELFFFIK